MKIIAFKRANSSSLHPLFITEYIDAALLDSTEGYETMIEEHFLLELAKNEERHQAHLQHLREQEVASHRAQEQAELAQLQMDRELEREFNRFKAWRRHQGKK